LLPAASGVEHSHSAAESWCDFRSYALRTRLCSDAAPRLENTLALVGLSMSRNCSRPIRPADRLPSDVRRSVLRAADSLSRLLFCAGICPSPPFEVDASGKTLRFDRAFGGPDLPGGVGYLCGWPAGLANRISRDGRHGHHARGFSPPGDTAIHPRLSRQGCSGELCRPPDRRSADVVDDPGLLGRRMGF
jgi:hypothetical protein